MTKDKLLWGLQLTHLQHAPPGMLPKKKKDLQNVTEIQNNVHTEDRNEKRGGERPKNAFHFKLSQRQHEGLAKTTGQLDNQTDFLRNLPRND